MTHVFISYSRKDSDFVDQLEAELNQRGINTWRDKSDIRKGSSWYKSLVDALNNAYAMICIVSPDAVISDWVRDEQLYARERNISLLPVLFQPHPMPLHLKSIEPINCGEGVFKIGVGQLVTALKPLQSNAPAPKPAQTFDANRLREEYLRFLLAETKADLRDALYVELSAHTERAKPASKPQSALSHGLEMDMFFDLTQLGLEQIRGENFDGRGDDVMDARQPINEHRKIVLLGEPGAGKTTTLLKLVVDYARTAQTDPDAILPVFVPLREFNGATSFTAFVEEKLGILQGASDSFKLFYLLDALNEMPRQSADGRDLVAEVRDFLRDKSDWAVSCRVRDYQDDLQALAGCGKVRIKPLDLPQIYDFIGRFYASNHPDNPDLPAKLWGEMKGSDDLLKAWQILHDKGNQETFWGVSLPDGIGYSWDHTRAWEAMNADPRRMMRLCRNPYMLTMVCGLFGMAGQLPANRGKLFQQFVAVLLKREETSASAIGSVWLDSALIRAGLAQIAYAMGAQTEMTRTQAESILQRELPDVDADLLLRSAGSASLIDVGQDVRFTHQLLQEYFASEVLGALVDAGTDPHTLWKPQNWWEANGREETLIILAGVRGDPEGVARWVAPANPELGVQVLTDSGVAVDLAKLDTHTKQALIDSAHAKTSEPNPIGRASAYRVLGLFDADKRKGIGVIIKNGVKLPDIEWVTIPAGEFTMGHEDEEDNPNPPRILTIDYDYQIARYPITYAQFQTFLDDPEGFNDPDNRWFAGLAEPDTHKPMREQAFKYANHPRERVNWYQAIAFCRWLSWRLGGGYDLEQIDQWGVRLPTEFEWEKAARGMTGWAYPWGDDFDWLKLNGLAIGIKMTSAVGIFTLGDAPHWNQPISDLSGNVIEWCLTDYDKPQTCAGNEILSSDGIRALRGGTWFNGNPEEFGCGYRDRLSPSSMSPVGGFRISRFK
jgi:formylglycine-generating enzyme required for sulfatase activity